MPKFQRVLVPLWKTPSESVFKETNPNQYLLMSLFKHTFEGKTTSLVVQMVKNPPETWETWVPSLGWEDPLEKEMTTHSSILVWRIPWTEEPGGLKSMGSQSVWHN